MENANAVFKTRTEIYGDTTNLSTSIIHSFKQSNKTISGLTFADRILKIEIVNLLSGFCQSNLPKSVSLDKLKISVYKFNFK